jgi:quinol monooxygenase YgiN
MSELQGIARFRFHPGKVEEFKRLSAEAMEISAPASRATLQYETYFNDDESEAMVLERYRDSQALIDHGQNMAHLMSRSSRRPPSPASSSASSARSSGR